MSKQIEALKMVNDILDDELWFPNKYPDEAIPVCFIDALKACKEALAEAEKQEPAKQKVKILYEKNGIQTCEILPTATWQSLSDDEIQNELKNMWDKGLIPSYSIVAFARSIEQALKEKNHG